MQQLIEESLEAMVVSHEQLARTLEAQKAVVTRMARMIRRVQPAELAMMEGEPYTDAEYAVAREISSYIGALAELEHALVDHVKFAVKELRIAEQE